jgi:hypothetical protein
VIVVQDGGGAAEVMGPSRDDASMQGNNRIIVPCVMITSDVWNHWHATGAPVNVSGPVELPSQSSALNESKSFLSSHLHVSLYHLVRIDVLASFSGRGPTYGNHSLLLDNKHTT